jgi:ureidoacrylate peracid hydrolase
MTTDTLTTLSRTTSSSSALVVVDVQNDFCAKGGYYDRTGADLTLIEPAVERIVRLIAYARRAGVMVVFVRSQYDPLYLSRTQTERRRRVGWDIPLCQVGTRGFEFYRVQPEPGDPVITKHRFDAFHGTDLELVLRTNGKEHLFFAGVATNVCVESSLRSGFMRDFQVILVEDCAAARNRRAHEGTVENVLQHFGLVIRLEELMGVWDRRQIAKATEPG